MFSRKRVYFWGEVCQYACEDFEDEIGALLEGHYKSLDLEKLRGSEDVYSIRTSKSGRLLFTTLKKDGEAFILILTHLPNHEYENSKFLKSSFMRQFREGKQMIAHEAFESSSSEDSELAEGSSSASSTPSTQVAASSRKASKWEAVEWISSDDAEENATCAASAASASSASSTEKPTYKPLSFHKDRFVEITDVQSACLKGSLPMLVSGAAGSGKTLIALAKIRDFIRQTKKEERVVYLTRSNRLANSVYAIIASSPALSDEEKSRIEVTTYEEFVCSRKGIKQEQLVGEAQFYEWLKGYNLKKSPLRKIAGEALYREMKLILSDMREVDYLQHHKRESHFTDNSIKSAILKMYETYCAHLKESARVDLDLLHFKLTDELALLVVDEAQDLSFNALRTLTSPTDQLIFLMDTNQSLQDGVSVRPFLIRLLQSERPLTVYDLRVNHRNSQAVKSAAQWVLNIKNALVGIGDEGEYVEIEGKNQNVAGRIELLPASFKLDEHDALKKILETTQCAVIVQDESHKEEAEKIYRTELIFTIEEIKGLEYDHIILHRFFDESSFKDISKNMPEGMLDYQSKRSRSKKKESGIESVRAQALHRTMTAFTRARVNLTVVQDHYHGIDRLYDELEKMIEQESPTSAAAAAATSSEATTANAVESTDQESSKRDWMKEALKLRDEGAKKQAHAILVRRLGYSTVEADAFVNNSRRRHKASAPMAASGQSATSDSSAATGDTSDNGTLSDDTAASTHTRAAVGNNFFKKRHAYQEVARLFSKGSREEAADILKEQLGYSNEEVEAYFKNPGRRKAKGPRVTGLETNAAIDGSKSASTYAKHKNKSAGSALTSGHGDDKEESSVKGRTSREANDRVQVASSQASATRNNSYARTLGVLADNNITPAPDRTDAENTPAALRNQILGLIGNEDNVAHERMMKRQRKQIEYVEQFHKMYQKDPDQLEGMLYNLMTHRDPNVFKELMHIRSASRPEFIVCLFKILEEEGDSDRVMKFFRRLTEKETMKRLLDNLERIFSHEALSQSKILYFCDAFALAALYKIYLMGLRDGGKAVTFYTHMHVAFKTPTLYRGLLAVDLREEAALPDSQLVGRSVFLSAYDKALHEDQMLGGHALCYGLKRNIYLFLMMGTRTGRRLFEASLVPPDLMTFLLEKIDFSMSDDGANFKAKGLIPYNSKDLRLERSLWFCSETLDLDFSINVNLFFESPALQSKLYECICDRREIMKLFRMHGSVDDDEFSDEIDDYIMTEHFMLVLNVTGSYKEAFFRTFFALDRGDYHCPRIIQPKPSLRDCTDPKLLKDIIIRQSCFLFMSPLYTLQSKKGFVKQYFEIDAITQYCLLKIRDHLARVDAEADLATAHAASQTSNDPQHLNVGMIAAVQHKVDADDDDATDADEFDATDADEFDATDVGDSNPVFEKDKENVANMDEESSASCRFGA